MSVPDMRIRRLNREEVIAGGDYVLYWMVAFRRLKYNFALQRAVEWANELRLPLVVLEALRLDYPWASHRLHSFVIDGMKDSACLADRGPVLYCPYVEDSNGAGKRLVEELARRSSIVVTDDYPTFFITRKIEAAARKINVRVEAVDSNGLLPLRATASTYPSAYTFRRMLQKRLPEHLLEIPLADPVSRLAPPSPHDFSRITSRWPAAKINAEDVAKLPVDQSVRATQLRGGSRAAGETLSEFLQRGLPRYASERNDLRDSAASGLSPYLHFGHISTHEIFAELTKVEDWSPARLGGTATGKRASWWGMSENAEAFLDQLVTWRELGFNECVFNPGYDKYESLPNWAQASLNDHATDPRPELYSPQQLENAETADPLWNAAQRQLVREGRVHNYLRMLWGKKLIEWSAHPRQALDVMIHLNNKYALDGRDPNSYGGIFWCFGRYDRPWPERPIFGKVRYMSSASTARKLDVAGYLLQYSL